MRGPAGPLPVLPAHMLPGGGQILGQKTGRAGFTLNLAQVRRNTEAARQNDFAVRVRPETHVFICHVVQNLLASNIFGGTAEALENMLQMAGINVADQTGRSHLKTIIKYFLHRTGNSEKIT